ncbi:MAG: alpha/beta fold hydrolase, partial [Candidatus Eisenbacteria bacterium]|nr:alpha/beta fold hydrolase [Candidatus Eisenbacteria bacterium]
HVHGYAGTFYENRFVSEMGDALASAGVAMLAVNNRGHDYVADNLSGSGSGTTTVPGGAAYDLFERTLDDIDAYVGHVRDRGFESVWFSGHSLGTLRVVHYLSERGEDGVRGIVLISPPDMFGLLDQRTEGRFEAVVSEAREFVEAGRGDELITAGRDHPVSAASLVSLYGDPSVTDVFAVRQGDEGDYDRIEKLSVPALVTMGDVEEAVTIDPARAAELVASHLGGEASCVVISGANHVYWGHEVELVRAIVGFVDAAGQRASR